VELRQVWKWSVVLALLALISVVFVDRPLAATLQRWTPQARQIVGPVVDAVELVFGFSVSKFLTGAVILGAGAALFPFRRRRSTAWLLLLLGLAQVTTRLLAGVLKNVFLRPRPFEALAGGRWQGDFFTAGSSFPSGHTAHFWPFFFVAAFAFPRWRIPMLLLAASLSISRILVNDHFLGDVLASAAIAAGVSYGYGLVIVPRLRAARNELPS
jgi:membrane-associated phospholipid phosphatase